MVETKEIYVLSGWLKENITKINAIPYNNVMVYVSKLHGDYVAQVITEWYETEDNARQAWDAERVREQTALQAQLDVSKARQTPVVEDRTKSD